MPQTGKSGMERLVGEVGFKLPFARLRFVDWGCLEGSADLAFAGLGGDVGLS
jgi:hypothetical protein